MRITTGDEFGGIVGRLRGGQGLHFEWLNFEWLNDVAENHTCVGLIGGYTHSAPFEEKLGLEWKLRRPDNLPLLEFLERDVPAFTVEVERAVGQPAEWQPSGKGRNGNNAILVVRYRDREDREESEATWAARVYPAFCRAIESHVAQRRP